MAKQKLPALPEKAPGIPKENRYKEQYGVIIIVKTVDEQKSVYDALKAVSKAGLRVVST